MTDKEDLNTNTEAVRYGIDDSKLSAINRLSDKVDHGMLNAELAEHLADSLIHNVPYEYSPEVIRETFYLLEKLMLKFSSNLQDMDFLIEWSADRPDLIANILTLLAIDRRKCYLQFIESCLQSENEMVQKNATYALQQMIPA